MVAVLWRARTLACCAAVWLACDGRTDRPPFAIDSVDCPDTMSTGDPPADLSVAWVGDLAFPATVIHRPRLDGCPLGEHCPSPERLFESEANPLVLENAVVCTVMMPAWFNYEVVIVDRNGVESEPVRAAFYCEDRPTPVRGGQP